MIDRDIKSENQEQLISHKIKRDGKMKYLIYVFVFNWNEYNQNNIRNLNLVELCVGSNKKIHNVSFMTSLKKLMAWDFSSIDQNGIKGLDIIELNTDGNDKIYNVSFMTSLKNIKCE